MGRISTMLSIAVRQGLQSGARAAAQRICERLNVRTLNALFMEPAFVTSSQFQQDFISAVRLGAYILQSRLRYECLANDLFHTLFDPL